MWIQGPDCFINLDQIEAIKLTDDEQNVIAVAGGQTYPIFKSNSKSHAHAFLSRIRSLFDTKNVLEDIK